MPLATRLFDMSAGSCGCPPIPCSSTLARNVMIGTQPPVVVGSFWGVHCDDDECHAEVAVMGNPKILVNGKPIVFVGCKLSNGDTVAMGYPKVIVKF